MATTFVWPFAANCGKCGQGLALREGVGRMCVTHAHGNDRCHPPQHVEMLPEDAPALQALYDSLEAHLVAGAPDIKGHKDATEVKKEYY